MTEEQIERRVSALIDALDRAYMRRPAEMTEAEYTRRIREIDRWADAQLARRTA